MKPRVRTDLRTSQQLRLTVGLTTAIRILRYDASGLARYLDEQAAENPFLRLDHAVPAAGEWLPRWTGVFRPAADGADAAEAAGPPPSLHAHVAGEIRRLFPRGPARDLAEAIAQAMEPSGWLGRPLAAVAAEEGVPLAAAEAVLATLQTIDPPGLFARNLAECLELQAREAGWFDPVVAVLLAHLPLVAQGDTARLARLAGADAGEVAARIRRIRTLNPKPGTAFDAVSVPAHEPDLIATRAPGGVWRVALNRSALPAVGVAAAARGAALAPEARARQAEARALARMVAERGATLLRIGAEIVNRQGAALDRGPAALRPMTMAEVAAAVGLHEATVSRAVAGVSLDTPSGPLWLRRMFTRPLGPAAAPVAAGAVRARLAALVAGEDPARPLSDAALAAALAAEGLPAARRTVAKYREMLGVAPAHLRRRQNR
jgi:RNA polymerase sigma-54 factor